MYSKEGGLNGTLHFSALSYGITDFLNFGRLYCPPFSDVEKRTKAVTHFGGEMETNVGLRNHALSAKNGTTATLGFLKSTRGQNETAYFQAVRCKNFS